MNDPLPIVGAGAVDEIAALCERAIQQPLSADDLRGALFAADQPCTVRFDPTIGVVATVRSEDQAFIRLLAVDPAARRRGHGRSLLSAAEADVDGASVVTVGADPPYFLFPGVPTAETALCCLLERQHYTREEANYNVDVALDRLDTLGPDPLAARSPHPEERSTVAAWTSQHWPGWRAEVLRAFDNGTLLLAGDDEITGFCAYDVNRPRTLGPIASRPDLIGRGVGRPLLVSALHRMRARGYRTIEVLWVGPLVPYASVGGRIGSVFFVYRKRRKHRP